MMKQNLIENVGLPATPKASHPLNLNEGMTFSNYYVLCIALGLLTMGAVMLTMIVPGLALKFIGVVCWLSFGMAFLVAMSRAFVRFREVNRYQLRGYKVQVKERTNANGIIIYDVADSIDADGERLIKAGYKSAMAADDQLAFCEMLPGMGTPKPSKARKAIEADKAKALTQDDIERIIKERERQMLIDFQERMNKALAMPPPSKATPTESESATKNPPSPSKKRKCRKCGYVAADIGQLNRHLNQEHRKPESKP